MRTGPAVWKAHRSFPVAASMARTVPSSPPRNTRPSAAVGGLGAKGAAGFHSERLATL